MTLAAFQRVLGDDFILHAADDLRPPAPAPSDTEQPEPVECSDPEALAAAVAAGQVVEGMTPGGGWVRLVREGAWGAVDQWRNWLSRPGNRARIWPSGSTPGGAA